MSFFLPPCPSLPSGSVLSSAIITTSFHLPPSSVLFSVTEQCPFLYYRAVSFHLPSGNIPSSAIGQYSFISSATEICRAVSFHLLPGSVFRLLPCSVPSSAIVCHRAVGVLSSAMEQSASVSCLPASSVLSSASRQPVLGHLQILHKLPIPNNSSVPMIQTSLSPIDRIRNLDTPTHNHLQLNIKFISTAAPSHAASHNSIGHSLLRIWQDQLGPPLSSQGPRPHRRSPATAVRREGATYSRGS